MGLLGRVPLKPLSFSYDPNIEGDREAKIAEILQIAVERELIVDKITGEFFIANVSSQTGILELVSMTEKVAEYIMAGGGISGDNITVTVNGKEVILEDAIAELASGQDIDANNLTVTVEGEDITLGEAIEEYFLPKVSSNTGTVADNTIYCSI